MSSTNNNNFTRGAQLWAHNMRMAIQGVKNICFVGLGFVLILLVIRCCQYLTFETIYYFLIQYYAEFKLDVAPLFGPQPVIFIDYYSLSKGVFVHIGAEQFIDDFFHIRSCNVLLKI